MIAFKIWGLAQALNTIAVCLFLGAGGLIVTPFAIVGGLPALLLFDLLLLWQRRYNHSACARLIACCLFMPAATAACSFTVASILDSINGELLWFAITPTVTVLLSVLLLRNTITQYKIQSTSHDTVH